MNILNTSLFNYSAGTFRPCLQKEQESSSDLAQQVPLRQKDTIHDILDTHVAGAWTERQKMFLGGSFFKLADDNKYIKNPEAQNPEVRVF